SAKSADLRDFESVLRIRRLRFVDLQYGDTLAERQLIQRELGIHIEHLSDVDNTKDIDRLAALVAACDLRVTVSNTTAHLAGALGIPTWVLVPPAPKRFWYWFSEGQRSPWYPCVHVRRQGVGQNWAQLISSIQSEISTFLISK